MVFDLAKRSPVFRAKKTGPCRFVNSGRYPSEKNRQIVVSNVSSPVKLKRKKMKKKEAYFVPKYRRKTICARNIRGFLFIRKNSCSRLRFGNSFRYSKQNKKRRNFVKSKKIRKNTNCLFRPYMKRRVFAMFYPPCLYKLMVGRLSS